MKKRALSTVFERIQAGTTTRAKAALELGVSERHVNRLMQKCGVQRPTGQWTLSRQASEERKKLKLQAATMAKGGLISMEQAAIIGRCSTRTIYRLLGKVDDV